MSTHNSTYHYLSGGPLAVNAYLRHADLLRDAENARRTRIGAARYKKQA